MKREKHKILVFGNAPGEKVKEDIVMLQGYDVSLQTTVPETLSSLIEDEFDLVLLQDQENQEDALKVCRIIKSHRGFRFLPVIYLTSSFNKDHLIRAYEAGADEYIEHTYNLDDLKDIINMKLIINDRRKAADKQNSNKARNHKFVSNEIAALKQQLLNQKTTIMDLKKIKSKMNIEEIKGKFLQIIVQELRSPISAIIGFTDILKQDEENGGREILIDTLGDASRKSKELLDLALAITDIDSDKSVSKMRPYKVSSVLEYAIADHSQIINDKRISITGPAESELTEVVIDPGLIKEVVRILLFNAIWHTPKDGHIDISICESVDKVELRIDDFGTGFNLSDLNTLTSFLKIPGIGNRSEWPGLRFAIAKFIMEIHHAEIKVENNTHGGATAKMIFPVNNAQREALHQLLSQLN
jgi:K+-sensing histidine kinase KdpD